MTVSGVSSPVGCEREKAAILTRIGQNHPQLRDLVLHPDADVITIDVPSSEVERVEMVRLFFRDSAIAIPIVNLNALRDGIVEE